MDRRYFLRMSLPIVLLTAATPAMSQCEQTVNTTAEEPPTATPERPPRIAEALVHEFVGVAHADLARVKALLAAEPKLVNAVWDWGGGDYESALGAAAHMGRADIAEYLLAHGTRVDLYAAAMLGKLEMVQATLAVFPAARTVPGPHGIPLIVHAKAGGEAAIAVYRYLESLG